MIYSSRKTTYCFLDALNNAGTKDYNKTQEDEFLKQMFVKQNILEQEWNEWLLSLAQACSKDLVAATQRGAKLRKVPYRSRATAVNNVPIQLQCLSKIVDYMASKPPDIWLEDLQRFVREFSIDKNVLFQMVKKQDKDCYIRECIKNTFLRLKVSNSSPYHAKERCKTAREFASSESKGPASKTSNRKLSWLNVSTKFKNLQPRLKENILQAIYEADNQEIIVKAQQSKGSEKINLKHKLSTDFDDHDVISEWTPELESVLKQKILNLKKTFNQEDFLKKNRRFKSVCTREYNTIAMEDISRRMVSKKNMSKDALLYKFLERQQSLTQKQIQYLMQCIPLEQSSRIDKKLMNQIISKIDKSSIDQMELKLADEILRKFKDNKEVINRKRSSWKREQSTLVSKFIKSSEYSTQTAIDSENRAAQSNRIQLVTPFRLDYQIQQNHKHKKSVYYQAPESTTFITQSKQLYEKQEKKHILKKRYMESRSRITASGSLLQNRAHFVNYYSGGLKAQGQES